MKKFLTVAREFLAEGHSVFIAVYSLAGLLGLGDASNKIIEFLQLRLPDNYDLITDFTANESSNSVLKWLDNIINDIPENMTIEEALSKERGRNAGLSI